MQHRAMALDRLRAGLVVLVVLHHAALAYASFAVLDADHYLRSTAPIVDPRRWSAVDWPIVFNDGFFMPLMFLLSGLFAWPSLTGRGACAFARQRLRRLGIPFLLAALALMPLAHYPALLARGTEQDWPAYWWHSATQGPWPTGPLWFVWLLLAFDLALSAAYAAFPRTLSRVESIGRTFQRGPVSFTALLAFSLAAYLPMLLAYGADHWFAAGPFAVQASRLGLYAVYFLAGVALGAGGAGHAGSAWQSGLARHWLAWLAVAAVAFLALSQVVGRFGGGSSLSSRLGHGIALALFAATAAHAAVALSLRLARGASAGWDSLAANGYGIYLVHYVPVVWLQYALLTVPVHAAVKCTLVSGGALAVSWIAVAAVRRNLYGARLL